MTLKAGTFMGKGKFEVCRYCQAQNDTVVDGICDTCRRAGEGVDTELDLNNDGVVDDKDATIAAKTLNSRRVEKKAKKK